MNPKTEWEKFFDGHAPVYNQNVFTRNTVAEVDFLIEALGLTPGATVLDVGCGTGRHSIELARRNFKVVGIDLSSGMLEQARKDAEKAGVSVEWKQANAADFSVDRPVDGVICLCEGAFGLLGRGDDTLAQPLAILHNVAAALKPGARCLFTVLNALAMVRRHTQADADQDLFDPLTMSEVSDCSPGPEAASAGLRERAFVPTELVLLFTMAGLEVLHIWGGTAGDWGKRKIRLDEMEIMVLGRKSSII